MDNTVQHTGSAQNLADNPWEKTTLTINNNPVSWRSSILLLRGQANEVIVEAPPEVARQIRLAWVNDDGLTIDVQPDSDTWVSPLDGKFQWKLTPKQDERGRGILVLYSREVNQTRAHACWVVSQDLSDEVNALIDGLPIPETGAEFFWDRPRELTLEVDPESPVAALPISLNWVSGTGVAADDFDVSPELEEPQTEHKWSITGRPTNTGTFNMAFVAKDLPVPLSLDSSRLVGRTTYKVLIDGLEHKPGVDVAYPVRDQDMSITLIREAGSKSDPVFSLKQPAYPGTAVSTPAFGVSVPVGVDGHTWRVKFSGHDRPFTLEFDGLQTIALNMYPGYHNSSMSITPITSVVGGSTRVLRVVVPQDRPNIRVSWNLNGKVVDHFSGPGNSSQAEVVRTEKGLFSAWIYVQGEHHSIREIRIT